MTRILFFNEKTWDDPREMKKGTRLVIDRKFLPKSRLVIDAILIAGATWYAGYQHSYANDASGLCEWTKIPNTRIEKRE